MWTCARVHEPGADLEGNGVVRMWMDAEGNPAHGTPPQR